MKTLLVGILLSLLSSPLQALSIGNVVPISPMGSNSMPQLAVAENGNALAVWLTFPNFIQVSFFSHREKTWYYLGNLTQGSIPQIGVDNTGNGIIVWVNTNNQIQATHFNSSTKTFSPFLQLSATGTSSFAPKLATSAVGSAIALWIQNAPYQILATTYNPVTKRWSAPTVFGTNIYPSSLILDRLGSGVAIFGSGITGLISAFTIEIP